MRSIGIVVLALGLVSGCNGDSSSSAKRDASAGGATGADMNPSGGVGGMDASAGGSAVGARGGNIGPGGSGGGEGGMAGGGESGSGGGDDANLRDAVAGGGGGALAPDVGPEPDLGPFPDVGGLDGDPCDPRLNAIACAPGQFCVHVPGALDHIGRCQQGHGCRFGHAEDCPDPERPYCHLKGGATVCSAPADLAEGDDCVDQRTRIPQPCAEGFACNFSVCQRACDPAAENPNEQCPGNGRCVSITDAVLADFGLCMPPACSFFSNADAPCDDDEKCGYAIRGDGVIVGSCFADQGNNQEGSPCAGFPEGGDNCGQGLLCVGPPDQEKFCRTLCDMGHYQQPCGDGLVCQERLATVDGPVRGIGICVQNQ